MRCPVCRADNGAEATCRRCRADLSLLADLEQARAAALRGALQAAAAGDGAQALRQARLAHELRPDRDSWRSLALGFFLMHDFTQALAHRERAQAPPGHS